MDGQAGRWPRSRTGTRGGGGCIRSRSRVGTGLLQISQGDSGVRLDLIPACGRTENKSCVVAVCMPKNNTEGLLHLIQTHRLPSINNEQLLGY